jgi:hypothetical protein
MRIRRPTGPGASPLPGTKDNGTEQKHFPITLVQVGGKRFDSRRCRVTTAVDMLAAISAHLAEFELPRSLRCRWLLR